MGNQLVRLRTASEIDVEKGLTPGFDGVLNEDDPGYNEFKNELNGLAIKMIPADFYENLDKTPGFSPLERSIADQHLRTVNQYIDAIRSNALNHSYPLIPTDVRVNIAFNDIIKLFYISPQMDGDYYEPITGEMTDNILTAVERGTDLALNQKSCDALTVDGLPDVVTRYIFGKVAAELFESGDYYRISYDANELIPSFKEIVSDYLYGPLGFYEVGVGMSESKTSYESPVNFLSPIYGKMMAAYIFNIYKDFRSKGLLGKDDEFAIFEHGGWDGKFADDILTAVSKNNSNDPLWQDFKRNLKYTGVEISPAGVALQKKLEEKFPNFKVVLGDALEWKPEKKTNGVALSVLMMDSFPPHMVHMANDKIYAEHIVPAVMMANEKDLDSFLERNFPFYSRGPVKYDSNKIKKEVLGIDHDFYSHLYLSKERWKDLQERLAKLKTEDPKQFDLEYADLLSRLQFIKVWVPSDNIPDLKQFVSDHAGSVEDRLSRYPNLPFNTEMDRYVKNVSEYFNIGAMVAVDVGSVENEHLLSRFGAVQIPQLMMQQGSLHLDLKQLFGNIFGSTVLYLVPETMLLFETLNKYSKQNAHNDPHMALADYSEPTREDMRELSLAKTGKDDEENMAAAYKFFIQMMSEGEFSSNIGSGHKITTAILGDSNALNCYNWHKKIEEEGQRLRYNCDRNYYSRCIKNGVNYLKTAASYLSDCVPTPLK